MTAETSNARGEWVLVPREPTEAMREAFNDWRPTEGNNYAGAQSFNAQERWEFRQRYAAMLASAAPSAPVEAAWNEGFDFALRAAGWQEGEDPATEGLYVVRDSKGNIEVGFWYAKTFNSQPAEWSREFVDVDRDDIVAWIRIPPYGSDND